MNSFKILSYEEENKLSNEERKIYYIELKKYLCDNDYTLNKKMNLAICELLNKRIIRYIINKIKGYKLNIENQNLIPDESVIFASTHQDFNDHFNIVLSIPTHTIILNSIDVPYVVKLLMNTNGIEYVDRNSSESRFKAKINLMSYLVRGKSVVVFPEATYNCSPNKLILPLHSGVIDMAKKMQVPIVPLVQEYNFVNDKFSYKEKVSDCTVRFGRPIRVSFDDDIREKKEELRDSLATMRYELISRRGIFDRQQISDNEYIDFLLSRLHTMELMGVDYETERKTIYGADEEIYKYYPINAVSYGDSKKLLKYKKDHSMF